MSEAKPDYYSLLGVARTASIAELRLAYRKLARAMHPDRHPGDKAAEERFKRISEAYSVLSDEKSRAAYDAAGWRPRPRAAPERAPERRVRTSKERLLTRDLLEGLYGERLKEILEALRRNVRLAGYWVSSDVLRLTTSMMTSRHFYVAKDRVGLLEKPYYLALYLDLQEEYIDINADLRYTRRSKFDQVYNLMSIHREAFHSRVFDALWEFDSKGFLRCTLTALRTLAASASPGNRGIHS